MNAAARLNRIQADLQRAGNVIYCEGKTDPDILFGLLGITKPVNSVHGDVYVVGLSSGPSGRSEVQALLNIAETNGYNTIYGICDGDGKILSDLCSEFDPPHQGPLFRWKGYCIENMLAKAVWPPSWGSEPDWQTELLNYAPYAALNRIHINISIALGTLGLARFRNPQSGQPLEQASGIQSQLENDKLLIQGRDVAVEFNREYSMVSNAISQSIEEGHALINGKWFLRHLAPTRTSRNEDFCRQAWIAAVQQAGGAPEIRDWWVRITGAQP
jgi:hypothetical protein